jgi:hypothetical protein
MPTPFPFTAGQTLTAAQMNAITELPINDKTASHVLTAADAGDIVVMNSASATTITVNASVFTTGQVVEILNKGAGKCTVTAGTATVNGSGLALSQHKAGTLLALSSSVFAFISSGSSMQTQVTAFTSSGTFTPPTGVTYAVAYIRAGGGGAGAAASGTGGTSSVAFASGTVTATGGAGVNLSSGSSNIAVAGTLNSGQGATVHRADSATVASINVSAPDGALITAGAAVIPGTGITVTVGAGGTAGTLGAAGGSGYVYLEFQVPV